MRKAIGHGRAASVCALGVAAVLLAGGAVSAAAADVVSTAEQAVESSAESMAESAASSVETSVTEVEAVVGEEEMAVSDAETVESGAEMTESGAETPEMMERPSYDALDFVTPGEYKGLEIEVEAVSVTDNDVDYEIETAMSSSEAARDTLTTGTVEEGDIANIDFVGKKDGVAFDGGTSEGYELEIGSGSFIEGFEEGLVGVAIGDTVDLNLTFPEEYGNEELAGQEVVFTVTVNSVGRPKELDDDLASVLSEGEASTVDEYREWVRGRLFEEAEMNREEETKQTLAQMAVANCTFGEIPEDLVEYSVNELRSTYEYYAAMYGMEFGDFLQAMVGISEDRFDEYAHAMAEESLRSEYGLKAIAEQEGLYPEGEELKAAQNEIAEKYGFASGEEIVAQYGEEVVNDAIANERTLDFLLANAVVTEKAPEVESLAESIPEAVEEYVEEEALTVESEAEETVAEETTEEEAASAAVEETEAAAPAESEAVNAESGAEAVTESLADLTVGEAAASTESLADLTGGSVVESESSADASDESANAENEMGYLTQTN